MTGPERPEKPAHPHVQATLLMLGVVFFLVLVAALEAPLTTISLSAGAPQADDTSSASATNTCDRMDIFRHSAGGA